MELRDIAKKLRKLGYDRDDFFTSTVQNKALIEQDYSNKTLNHMVLIDCRVLRTNFDYAAATGSIFKLCEFTDCSMYQPDFEFCSFYDCTIQTKAPVLSSFNNCNFINVEFIGVVFESCTFTGALFENCTFRGGAIKASTLENALFQNCSFFDMDLRHLNMDFVHLEQPHMVGTILPFSQLPYMFGCLHYLMTTEDSVKISSGASKTINKEEYLEKAIPLLLQYWVDKSNLRPEFYFPLSNYYIAKKDYANAITYLRQGLQSAVVKHDFRMIKFYCKLISESNLFDLNALHRFYEMIKRFGSVGSVQTPEMRSFMRNIGEIKTILFHSQKKPSLSLRFKTNLFSSDFDKVSAVLGRLFSIAKMNECLVPNAVEIVLSENSPLLIHVQVSGDEDNLLFLLPLLMQAAGVTADEINHCVPFFLRTDNDSTSATAAFQHTQAEVHAFSSICHDMQLHLSLSEYFLENCEAVTAGHVLPFYCPCEDANPLMLHGGSEWQTHIS